MDAAISKAILWVAVALVILVALAYILGWALSTLIGLISFGVIIILGLSIVGLVNG